MHSGNRKYFYILILLGITDLIILLDILFLRQILGFLFFTIIPGLLILQILKIKIDFLEKFVLSWGLSISFLMFFGLLTNNLSLSLGYETPLATVPLLISFNISFIVLAIIGYKINKEPIFSQLNLTLTTSEKAFLTVPILFPALSIFGMHLLNITDSNSILMFLLLLISIYVAFVCFFNQKFPKRLYPILIFLISISLLLFVPLRSNHIMGADINLEYYFFRTTLNNLHWSVFGHSTLDACLSISLLPTIYQSILNIPSEFLQKIIYSLIYSISPLVIYVLSRRYIKEPYAFLASCFFMFQLNFLGTGYNARANTAVLFFALAMMSLFSGGIDPLKKRVLVIVFMASCLVSHYSTTYIFFIIMLGSFLGIEILPKKYIIRKVISLTLVLLLFSMIFYWYSQVTETGFSAGICFIESTISELNSFFVSESRAGVQAMLGEGIVQKRIAHKIEFVFTWLTFVFIGVGIITLIRRYKEMSFPELNFKMVDFLKEKFEVAYFIITLVCTGLLIAMVAVPYISEGYSLDRLYAMTITFLSVFFVIGGIIISKTLSFIKQTFKKSLIKSVSLKKEHSVKKQKEAGEAVIRKEKKNSEVLAYLVILLVLIPYFLCVTGVMYNIFDVPRAVILNSEGEQYDVMYVHDQEITAAGWIGDDNTNSQKDLKIYSDKFGSSVVKLAYDVNNCPTVYTSFFEYNKTVNDGYIFLRYVNVVAGKVFLAGYEKVNMAKYSDMFVGKNRIYDNGGAEVWR